MSVILAIDQGTTGTTVLAIDAGSLEAQHNLDRARAEREKRRPDTRHNP